MNAEITAQLERIRRLGSNPLHRPDLVEKAIQTANWRDDVARQIAFSSAVPFESTRKAEPHERRFLCNALLALTIAELIELHDSLMACYLQGIKRGEDWTCQEVRDRHPHIYGPEDTKDAMHGRRITTSARGRRLFKGEH